MRKNKSEIKEVITDISETREILSVYCRRDGQILGNIQVSEKEKKEIGNLNRPSKSQDVATVIKKSSKILMSRMKFH